MIVAVLDVSLAVNLCINCSFLHLYLQFYYISDLLQQNCLFGLSSQIIRITGIDHGALQCITLQCMIKVFSRFPLKFSV